MCKLTAFFFGVLFSLTAFGQATVDLEFKHTQDSIRKLCRDTSLYFPQTKFVKVVGYTFNSGIGEQGSGEDLSIYDDKQKKFAKSINAAHIVLTKAQADTLLKILNDTTTFAWGMGGCFIPHHAFVFYNAKNKPVAYINICFMCSQTFAKPQTPIMLEGGILGEGWTRLNDFCKSVGLPMKI